jgi:hypothetical protein
MIIAATSTLLVVSLGLAAAQQKSTSAATSVVVYKSPTCGCCSSWIAHLKANGFQVAAHDVGDAELRAVGQSAGLTDNLASCHTAKVGGYIVEGHVPAADIQRMLKEKPAIAGIAVPGMPMGSPGMEQGGRKDPYDVIAFTKNGKTTVFAKH